MLKVEFTAKWIILKKGQGYLTTGEYLTVVISRKQAGNLVYKPDLRASSNTGKIKGINHERYE